MTGSPPKIHIHAALFLAMLIWASSFIAMKAVISEVDPMVAVALRMGVGALAFILLWAWLKPRFTYRRGDWKLIAGMALFEPCLYFIFEAQALRFTSAAQAGMVTALLPMMIAVGAVLFFKESLRHRQWLGLLLAIVGVAGMTLLTADAEQAPNPLLGNFLEFLAMASALGYTLLVKHLAERYSPFFLTAMQSFIGALFFLPLSAASTWPPEISTQSTLLIIYLGVVVNLGAYGMFNYGLSKAPASVAGAYINLIPALTVLLSVWLLSEEIQLVQWLAITLIFVGVYLSRQGPKPEALLPDPDPSQAKVSDPNLRLGSDTSKFYTSKLGPD